MPMNLADILRIVDYMGTLAKYVISVALSDGLPRITRSDRTTFSRDSIAELYAICPFTVDGRSTSVGS